MYQIHLPIKRYQNLAGIAAIAGFVFGVALPLYGFATGRWACPFGDRITHKVIFGLLSGVAGALILGNLAAVGVILIAKFGKFVLRLARHSKR